MMTAVLFLAAGAAIAQSSVHSEPPDTSQKALINDAPVAIDSSAVHAHGWFLGGASLLFYDGAGNLAVELPLVSEEDASQSRISAHSVIGGSSANARFGWTLEKTTTWDAARTKALASRRLLRVYGSEGKELWSLSGADAPETGEPVAFSANGETLMVALRTERGWTAQVKGYLGNTLYEIGPVPRLQFVALTRNGRYATARWTVPDQSATHTFVELPTKTRQDIPSGELFLGLARITEDGKIYSGKKLVFDFAVATKPGENK